MGLTITPPTQHTLARLWISFSELSDFLTDEECERLIEVGVEGGVGRGRRRDLDSYDMDMDGKVSLAEMRFKWIEAYDMYLKAKHLNFL